MARHSHGDPADDEDTVKIGKGFGGIAGGGAGAGLGAILGPAGVIVGGIAGALGGWWAGREVGEAADQFRAENDEYYRQLHEQEHADRCDYDDARCYYQLGHIAGSNPDYRGRGFEEVERDLRAGWREDVHDRFERWEDVRPFVSAGYEKRPRD